MVAAGSWTVLWVACFAAAAPRPVLALLRGAASTPSGTLAGNPLAAQSAQARLSVVDWNAYDDREQDGPGTYSFGYEIEDAASANTQFRQEERFANGTVVGSYGLVEPDGNVRVVNYVADAQGYRVRIENSLRKNENYPRSSPAQGRRPPKRPTDRLLDVDVLAAAAPTPPSPLTWALLALQAGGGRPPLQEQRLRPASAAQPQQAGQQRRVVQEHAEAAGLRGAQQGEEYALQRLQQQQQWRDGQAWYRSQGYLPGDTVQRYAHQDRVEDAAVLANHLAPASGGGATDSMAMRRSWTSQPIVVWPTPAAAAPSSPRYLLPPIPALDPLIYQRNS